MSFRNLKHDELVKAVKYFEVPDTSETNTRAELIAALEEKQISWSNYRKFVAVPEETDTDEFDVQFSKMVLLKMERQNPTFEVLGHKFTRNQPFQVMSEQDAQDVIDVAESMGGGFRIASPSEAKSYFG